MEAKIQFSCTQIALQKGRGLRCSVGGQGVSRCSCKVGASGDGEFRGGVSSAVASVLKCS